MTRMRDVPNDKLLSCPDDKKYELILAITIFAGVLYVVGGWWAPWWLALAGQVSSVSYIDYQNNALPSLAQGLAVFLPGAIIIGCSLFTTPVKDVFREKETVVFYSTLLFLVGHVCVFLLFSLSFDGYIDKSYKEGIFKMALLIKTGQYLAIVIDGVEFAIIAPVVEEVAVRFGLMQWIYRKYPSKVLAVSVTSIAFALGHIGTLSTSPVDMANFIYVAFVGTLLGVITVWRNWKITTAVAIHSVINATNYIILILVAMYSFDM